LALCNGFESFIRSKPGRSKAWNYVLKRLMEARSELGDIEFNCPGLSSRACLVPPHLHAQYRAMALDL
jgi:hypothetical protein